MTESSKNPVDSRFGLRTSETTHGSISTKCTWKLKEQIVYEKEKEIIENKYHEIDNFVYQANPV